MADRNCPQCKGRGFTTNAKGQAVAVCPACSSSVKPVGPDLKNYKKPVGPAVDSIYGFSTETSPEEVARIQAANKKRVAAAIQRDREREARQYLKQGGGSRVSEAWARSVLKGTAKDKQWPAVDSKCKHTGSFNKGECTACALCGMTQPEWARNERKKAAGPAEPGLKTGYRAVDKQWPACQEGRHQYNGKNFCGRCGEPRPKDVPVGDRRSRLHAALDAIMTSTMPRPESEPPASPLAEMQSEFLVRQSLKRRAEMLEKLEKQMKEPAKDKRGRLHAALDAVMTYSKPPVIRKTLSILNPNDLAKMTGSSEPQYIGKGKPYTGFSKDETPQEKARRKLSPEQAARLKELLNKVKPAPSAAAPMPRAKDSQHWMPETGNHALADKLHAQLTGEGFSPAFGSGNKAGDITYRYEKGKERAYLLARRNGQHTIERKAAGAYGKGLSKDVAAKKCHGCGKPTAGYYCAACEKKADTGYSKLAKDSSDFEVKKGRSGNWALFKPGSDYPESNWFLSKAKAAEELKRRGGKVSSKKEPAKEPDIFGYPWEYIQAMQRGDRLGAKKILLKRNSLDSDLQPV
jgi:uncharacterized Zn finger protein (UPF0148 family)